jgi:hypothetical protein
MTGKYQPAVVGGDFIDARSNSGLESAFTTDMPEEVRLADPTA